MGAPDSKAEMVTSTNSTAVIVRWIPFHFESACCWGWYYAVEAA